MRVYKEGITREEILRKQCCICGVKNVRFVFHHIVPRREAKSVYGVILCYQCHQGIHWVYKASFRNIKSVYERYQKLIDEIHEEEGYDVQR